MQNSFHCSAGRYQSTGLETIAHEYQHLICMSSTLLGNGRTRLTLMGTWLNESMAAAAEEWIYPGEMTELGYISRNYNGSGLISGGQSLYDFTTSSGDIGVYGQALLFSEYLKKQKASLLRRHRQVIYLNDNEMAVIEEYCRRFNVHTKASLYRTAIISRLLQELDENHPTLF